MKTEAEKTEQAAQAVKPTEAAPTKKEGTGQKVSQERGSHTHTKKNPGKRPSQGGN
jgi:hypothetical protein